MWIDGEKIVRLQSQRFGANDAVESFSGFNARSAQPDQRALAGFNTHGDRSDSLFQEKVLLVARDDVLVQEYEGRADGGMTGEA